MKEDLHATYLQPVLSNLLNMFIVQTPEDKDLFHKKLITERKLEVKVTATLRY